jgi:hypothetical protein
VKVVILFVGFVPVILKFVEGKLVSEVFGVVLEYRPGMTVDAVGVEGGCRD